MNFLPRKVVMILNASNWLFTKQFRHQTMNHIVVSSRIVAHQIHSKPVFLTFFGIHIKPSQPTKVGVFPWQIGLSHAAINLTNCRPCASTSAVAQEADVFASL